MLAMQLVKNSTNSSVVSTSRADRNLTEDFKAFDIKTAVPTTKKTAEFKSSFGINYSIKAAAGLSPNLAVTPGNNSAASSRSSRRIRSGSITPFEKFKLKLGD